MALNKTLRSKALLIFLLTGMLVLSGCSGGNQSTTLTGADKDAVLAYSEPAADHLMEAFNSGDYAAFMQDMNPAMTKSITQQQFDANMRGVVYAKIGNYHSRQVEQVIKGSNYVTVIYNAKFEKDSPVIIRLSFDPAEPHKISGIYFDSANLRKTN